MHYLEMNPLRKSRIFEPSATTLFSIQTNMSWLRRENRTHRPINIRLPDDVVFRDLSDEGVLLSLATGTYFWLDKAGEAQGMDRTRRWHPAMTKGRICWVICP